MDDLESLLDREGPATLLGLFEEACYGKAEHVRCDWQDESLARAWERLGQILGRAASAAHDLGL